MLAQNRSELRPKLRMAVQLVEARLWAACGFRIETMLEVARKKGAVHLPQSEVRPIVLWLQQLQGTLLEFEYNSDVQLSARAEKARRDLEDTFAPWEEMIAIEGRGFGGKDRYMTLSTVERLDQLRSAAIRFSNEVEHHVIESGPEGASGEWLGGIAVGSEEDVAEPNVRT